jgi:alpha-tubulin suppressor-like RCC1 family protein
MPFISGPDGDLKTAFISDSWLLDQFVGNTLFTWGNNGSGQLGDNTVTNKSNPVQTVTGGINWKSVVCGIYTTAAIKTDGTLWVWGENNWGQIGDNTVNIKRSSPVQTIAFGTNWKQVSVGSSHIAAVKTDGTLWTWGGNSEGRLGDNTTTARSSPVQTVTFEKNWKQVAAGQNHTAAIKTDGTLWTWGGNSYGQLGDNTIANRNSPVQTVTFGTNWKQVACGETHTAAIKTDGTLWCWGKNSYGNQLGDNTIINRSSPVQTVAGGTNWKQVAAGVNHTAAIKTDGTLWCWGKNQIAQIGDNTTTPRSSPVQTISFGNNWKSVACGNAHTAAIKTDGTLWAWGYNSYGNLGDNTTMFKASPVQTTAYGTNWKQSACGGNLTVAVTNGDI